MLIGLPVTFDTDIRSECWTFYKLAMIQAHPSYQSWILDHLRYTLNSHHSGYFGDYSHSDDTSHDLYYYRDILEYRQEPFFTRDGATLPTCIEKALGQGWYVVCKLEMHSLFSDSKKEPYVHEQLIYGIDPAANEVFTTYYDTAEMKIVRCKVGFERMIAAFEAARAYDDAHRDSVLISAKWYHFPMTLFRPKTYTPPGNQIIDMLYAFKTELAGTKVCSSRFNEGREPIFLGSAWEGISVMQGIAELCERITYNECQFDGCREILVRDVCQCSEYERILHTRMRHLTEVLSLSEEFLNLHEGVLSTMRICATLASKYQFTQDPNVPAKIRDHLLTLYPQKKALLSAFTAQAQTAVLESFI